MMPMLSPISHSPRPTARLALFVFIAAALVGTGALSPDSAHAQRGKNKDKNQPGSFGGRSGAGGYGGPPSGMKEKMAEQMRGMGSMMGRGGLNPQKKASSKKGATKQRDREAAQELDNEKLPDGYHVPQVPPDALTTTEEWIEEPFRGDTEKDIARDKRIKQTRYANILHAGDFANNDEKEFVRQILIWKLSTLTRKDEPAGGTPWRENAVKTRQGIEKDVMGSPSSKSGPRVVRKFLLKTIVEEAPKLFQYHFIARLNGAILLAELSGPDFNEEEAQGRNAAKPFVLAAEPLRKMVMDRDQLAAVRIWGVNGLVRLAVLPELSAAKRYEIVETLVQQMNDSGREHEWYQWRLAEGLGKLNVIQDQNKVPVVPQALAMVLADDDRPMLVRAEAALSLGRLPYDRDIDVGLVAYETGRLALRMTEEFEKEERKRSSWKLCFIKVYGAFKPIDEDDEKKGLGLLKQVGKGPLQSYKRTVTEAFERILPLVAKVVNNPSGIDVPLKDLRNWLEANPPKNATIYQNLEPIIKQARGQPPAEPVQPAGS
jgi:hypothetical protein